MRAKDNSFNATLQTDFDNGIGKINVVPQDIGRILLNLYNNAFYAVSEKAKTPEGFQNPRGFGQPEARPTGSSGRAQVSQLEANNRRYVPTVTIVTKKLNDKVEIRVSDNGRGIPQNIIDKIFQPFFTTKPTGEGTGLGLSLSYDIIKAHGGEISAGSGGKVQTKESTGLTADLSEATATSEAAAQTGSEFIILLPFDGVS